MREYSISCVVIGLNSERTLSACLESIKKQENAKVEEIIYADGGSSDKSISIAEQIRGIKVIKLNLKKPTPGRGRNAGWKEARGEWVHFFDSDVIVDKNWISEATKHIGARTVAVFGRRKELYPRRNKLHFVANVEWVESKPDANFFGGDILIKRSVLEETGGYNETLIAGEDPELSARIRNKGWKIMGVDAVMCYHDIGMANFRQYFRRSMRTGYAYAEAGMKMLKVGEKTFFLNMVKILTKGALTVVLITAATLARSWLIGLSVVAIIFFPFIKSGYFKKKFDITFSETMTYALHCSLVTWIHLLGILRYCLHVPLDGMNGLRMRAK